MKLEDFYKKVLLSTGFIVNEEGGIFITEDTPVMNNDLPYYLPSKENINSIYGADAKIKKILFNPLIEDYFNKKNSNISLKKVIAMGEFYLTEKIITIAVNLLKTTDVSSGDFKLTNFYNSLGLLGKSNPARKKLVDQNTHKVFDQLFSNLIGDPENKIVKFSQVNSGKIDKEKFNVVTSLYSPLLDNIYKMEKEGPITELLGVKVRQKDIDILIIILEYLLNGIKEDGNNSISIGSNNDYAGLESFLILYIALSEHLNEVTESLTNILKDDIEDDGEINLQLSLKDLEELPMLKASAITVPSEKSLANRVETPAPLSIKDKMKGYAGNMINNNVINANNGLPQNNNIPLLNNVPEQVNYNVAPSENNLNSIMTKITGMQVQPIINNNVVPTLANYNGVRPDLHVSHIYNEAPFYNNQNIQQGSNFGTFNPNGIASRFDNRGAYLSASERQQMNMGNTFFGNNNGAIIIP